MNTVFENLNPNECILIMENITEYINATEARAALIYERLRGMLWMLEASGKLADGQTETVLKEVSAVRAKRCE